MAFDDLAATMDEYMFRIFLSKCREATETTHYVEVMNYSVSELSYLGEPRPGVWDS